MQIGRGFGGDRGQLARDVDFGGLEARKGVFDIDRVTGPLRHGAKLMPSHKNPSPGHGVNGKRDDDANPVPGLASPNRSGATDGFLPCRGVTKCQAKTNPLNRNPTPELSCVSSDLGYPGHRQRSRTVAGPYIFPLDLVSTRA